MEKAGAHRWVWPAGRSRVLASLLWKRRACAPPAAALARDRHVPRGPLRLGASGEERVAGDEHAVDDVDDGVAVLSDDDVGSLRQGVRGRKGGRVAGGGKQHRCRRWRTRGAQGTPGGEAVADQGRGARDQAAAAAAAAAIPAAPAPAPMAAAEEQHRSREQHHHQRVASP